MGTDKDGIIEVRFLDTLKANVPPDEDWIEYLRHALPDLMAGSDIAHWRLYEWQPVLISRGGANGH